jgi:hypothetical protein
VEAARARTDGRGDHRSGSDLSDATLPSHFQALIPNIGVRRSSAGDEHL